MKNAITYKVRLLSIALSLLMVLSVISIPKISVSAEGGIDGFVERCYTVTLDRGSDPEGFADWKGQLLNGKSVGVNIAYGFLFSQEYKNKNKSNKDYVKDLYKLFMDREPDEAGFNDWVGKLEDGKSREEVFTGFANSQEFYNICDSYGITAGSFVVGYDRNQVNNVNLFVERLYQTCLGRRGDRGGQKDWVSKLLNKQITGIECARSFVQSKEYINKGLSDEDFVENMYKAMMGRASDEGGKTNWLNALANGKTRDEVFAGFANSKEFGDICNAYKIEKGSYTAKDIGTTKNTNDSNNNNNNNNNNDTDTEEKEQNTNDNIESKPDIPFSINVSELKKGDIVKIGRYEQDADESNGPEDIEWEVLSAENGKAFLITKYVIDSKRFSDVNKNAKWEDSTLRKWLNSEFLDNSFSKSEREHICLSKIENKANAYYNTCAGNDTEDKVFCLSSEEVDKYYGDYQVYSDECMWGYNQRLICSPTQYAINNNGGLVNSMTTITENVYTEKYYFQSPIPPFPNMSLNTIYSKDVIGVTCSDWWLRTSSRYDTTTCNVNHVGIVGPWGDTELVKNKSGVRPAMYIY